MKKASILATGLTFSLLFGAVIGLTACDNGETAHTHNIQTVAKKDATCTEAGYEAHYKCSDCEKLFSDAEGKTEISAPIAIAAAHKVETVAKKDATCTEAGYEAHYKCSACDKLFSDEAGTTVIEAATVIPAAHTLEAVAKKDATCTEAGYEAHYQCSVCEKLFSDEAGTTVIEAATVIPVTAHSIVEVSKKRPTCTEAGYEEHYKCEDCGALFADEEGTEPIEAATVIPAEHRIVAVPKKDATCVEAGYEAYWECTICETKFSDENAATEIAAPTVIAATGVHTAGFNYTADDVPAPEAAGGTLASVCAVCGADMGNVDYKAGLTISGAVSVKNGAKMDGVGTYYFQLSSNQKCNSYFGFQVKEAGTYRLTFTNVFSDEDVIRSMDRLWILKSSFPKGSYDWLMKDASWDNADVSEFSEITEEDVENYKNKVVFDGIEEGKVTQLNSITFTFTEEDVSGSKGLFVMIGLIDKIVNEESPTGRDPENSGSFLIKFEAIEEV
ncbi:MAG: hypothetical protein K2H43_02050 [Clostridia bacterium]|nr:hypothetical protein [Clostridia bacterium]